MSFIDELGVMAMGTRLKNLSELLMKDMTRVYKEQGFDFEPRWFTFFQLILQRKEVSVTEIARELNQSHPAAVQVLNMLEKKKLVTTRKDKSDQRKRLVRLSKKGQQLAEKLAPLWDSVHEISLEILNESDPNLLDRITKVENALKHKSTYTRIHEKLKQADHADISFIAYHENYSEEFRSLNEAWLRSYLNISKHDKEVLADPREKIIKKNGEIFLMTSGEEIIGSFALQKLNKYDCELSKFTIKKAFRGRNLGEAMLTYAINRAKKLNYQSIILFTHHELKEATQLYEKVGFTPLSEHPDIKDESGRCSILLKLIIHS